MTALLVDPGLCSASSIPLLTGIDVTDDDQTNVNLFLAHGE